MEGQGTNLAIKRTGSLSSPGIMYPQGRHPVPLQPGQSFKFTVLETLDRIKEEFQFLQAQYHSLKLECEKLASEKTEMQRHYVMYYEMSYGLNIEMHKQTEIAKRLNTICAQVIPFLSQEHQQQVVQAVERAKQVTMAELNAVIGVRGLPGLPPTQHLSHNHGGAPVPLTPHPAGLHPSQLGGSAGLLALSGALGALPPHLAGKDGGDKKPHLSGPDSHSAGPEHLREREPGTSNSLLPESLRNSDKRRNGPEFPNDTKKRKVDDKDSSHYDSDGEKSDDNLVVDVSNEDPASPRGTPLPSPRENGLDKARLLKKDPCSPASTASSASSSSLKSKEMSMRDKAGTPGLKSSTPTPRGDSTPGPSSTPGIRPSLSKPPSMEIPHPPTAGLRTPLAVPGPYPGAFGMLPHAAGMNGELAGAAGAAAYAAGLHNMSPQMSAAAAAAVAAYGRSPMVSGKG